MSFTSKIFHSLFLFSALLFLTNSFLFAQNNVIEGVLKDTETKDILPFCNVYLKTTQLGTVSNSEGKFRLLIPQKQKNDTVLVSYIGYKTNKIAVADLIKKTNLLETNFTIFLETDQTKLNEIVVQDYTADFIIQKAIESIPKNYYNESHKTKGFYRVISQKDAQQGKNYVHLSEAVFDLHLSKTENPNEQFKLEKMRAIKDEKASKGIDLGLKPKGIFEMDIVNYEKGIDLLTKKGLKLHTFELEDYKMVDGKVAFKITFDQKDEKKLGYKGYVLIDKETFAFLYFDFKLSEKGIKYQKYGDLATRALMNLLDIHIELVEDKYQIQYKKVGNKYYLNNASGNAIMNFSSTRQNFNFDLDTRVDYLTTKVDTTDKSPFENDEILGKGKLIEHQNSIYDKDFWKDYTIVLPSNDFVEIAKVLEANNKANDLKTQIEEKLYKFSKDKTIRMDSLLTFYNNEGLFNGNALIVYDGKTILQKSYNNELTQNSQNSQFRIGSLSKTFTAMLILQLENEGKISFEDSVGNFLPSYRHKQIKISELLSHQSGIPDYLKKNEYVTQIMTKAFSSKELVNRFCSDSLEFEPSQKFTYSNSNYVILARIIEKITNQDFGIVLKERIFEPLEMKNTFFGEGKTENSNLTKSFLYGKAEPFYFIQNSIGAGGITSTTEDLLKWSKALDGKNENFMLLSQIEKLFVPQAEYIDWEAYYGYGFMIDKYYFLTSKDRKTIYHPGTDFGFYTMFLKQPKSDITIILLNNTGDFPRFDISEIILNEFD